MLPGFSGRVSISSLRGLQSNYPLDQTAVVRLDIHIPFDSTHAPNTLPQWVRATKLESLGRRQPKEKHRQGTNRKRQKLQVCWERESASLAFSTLTNGCLDTTATRCRASAKSVTFDAGDFNSCRPVAQLRIHSGRGRSGLGLRRCLAWFSPPEFLQRCFRVLFLLSSSTCWRRLSPRRQDCLAQTAWRPPKQNRPSGRPQHQAILLAHHSKC